MVAAALAVKAVKKTMPATPPHWGGNGFHVYPVFANLAFTKGTESAENVTMRHIEQSNIIKRL